MPLMSSRFLSSGLFFVALFLAGCGGDQYQRLIKLSQESLKRQVEQNELMGRQSETVAESTHKLIEADAEARHEMINLQQDIQDERANLDHQHDELENERRSIAASRHRDPVIAKAIASAAMLLATCLPLILCFFLIKGLYGRDEAEALEEMLVSELSGTEPALFAPSAANSPRLEQQPPASQITLETRPALPADSSTVSRPKKQPVLVVLEGKHDIAFLKRISVRLHSEDPPLPNLAVLENEQRLIFIPTGGGNLEPWKNRFDGLNLPEIHVYDREVSPLTEERQRAAETVNARPGCRAFVTGKRAMENYIHPDAIREARGIDVAFDDETDVAELVAGTFLRDKNGADLSQLSRRARRRLRDKVKRWLNSEAVERMTAKRLAERDPDGDVRSWLLAIADLAEVSGN